MSTSLNPELVYPFQNPPEHGNLIEIADGLFWLRMPLPFSLAHINLWLLKDGDDWAIIDTGIKSDETKNYWKQIFDQQLGDQKLLEANL